MNIGTLTGELTLEDSMSSGLEMATAKVKQFGEHFGGVAGGVAVAAASIITAVTGIGAAMFGFAKHAATVGDAFGDFSVKTGLAIEKVGPLDFALKAAGSSLDSMNSMLMRLSLKEQGSNADKFAKALGGIGINAKAFAHMDADQKLYALADGFKKAEANGNAMSAAIAIGGKNFANYLPTLAKLTPELKAMSEQMAVIWTPEKEEQATKFNVSLGALEEAFKSIAVRVGMELMPVIGDLLDALAKNPAVMDGIVWASEKIVHGFGYMVQGIAFVVEAFAGLRMMFYDVGSAVMDYTAKVLEGIQLIAKAQSYTDLTGVAKRQVEMLDGMISGLKTKSADYGKQSEKILKDTIPLVDGINAVGNSFLSMGLKTDTASTAVANHHAKIKMLTPAEQAFADEVEKLANKILGVPEHAAEMSAALDKVAKMTGLTTEQIKAEVDAIDNAAAHGQKLTETQQDFLDQWGQMGTRGQAATKAMIEYADAAKAAHDQLTLVGLDLKKAEITQQGEVKKRGALDQFRSHTISADELQEAITSTDQATKDQLEKAQKDFDHAQAQEIQNANQAALDAQRDFGKKGLDLTIAKLHDQENAEIRQQDEKLRTGAINQETYDQTILAIDKRYTTLGDQAFMDDQQKRADASAQHMVDLLKITRDYHKEDELIGLSASDKAQKQLDQDYADRIAALGDYEVAISEGLGAAWDEAAAAADRWYLHEKDALDRAKDQLATFNTALGGLAATIAQLAQISGGSFGGIMKGVGEIVGHAQVAAQSAASYRAAGQAQADAQHRYDTALNADKNAPDYASNLAAAGANLKTTKITSTVGKVAAVAQGAMSVWSATEGGGAKGIAGGALAGMEAGSAFGPWGMAAGAAAGALVGVAKSFSNNTKKAREEFAKSMGKDSLGGLYEDLQHLGKAGEKLAETGQHVIGKKDDKANQKWMDDVKKFYDDIQKSLGEMADATGLWNEQQDAVAKNAKETGENLEAVNAARAAQAVKAGTGLSKALTISDTALQSYDALNAKQMDITKQMSETHDSQTLEGLQTQLDATMVDLNKMGKLWNIVKPQSESAAKAISSSLLSVAMSQIKAGASFTDTIRNMGPDIKALGGQLAATGYSGGQAFDFLAKSAAIVNDEIAGPALDAAAGYADALVGLANAGLMDQDTFSGLTEQIGGTETALEAQGFSHGAVMAAMQSDLQKVWEMQQKYGYSVDDATQKLIDEGVQSGLIGEQGKSDNEKILDVLMAIGEALGATIPEGLKKMTSAGDKAATDVQKNMKDMSDQMAADVAAGSAAAGGSLGQIAKHAPTSIDIPVNLTEGSTPTGSGFGHAQAHAGGGIVYAQGGAKVLPFAPRGTDTVPAMLTPGERVLTVDETKRYDAGGGDGANVHITLVMPDGDVLLRQVVKARKKLG